MGGWYPLTDEGKKHADRGASRRYRRSFLPPGAKEKDRQPCMKSDSRPQQYPRPAVGPDVNQI